MHSIWPVFIFCAACSPTSVGGRENDVLATRDYPTQTAVPSPNYRLLLKQPSQIPLARRERPASSALPANAKRVGDMWIARLKERKALLGYGLAGKRPSDPVEIIDTGLTEIEFASWTKRNRWSIPTHISWNFVPEMALPRVSNAAKNAARVWPASTSRTGLQNQALFYGKVELRNGCFFVGMSKQPADKLAWFHAETGLDVDASGYLVLRNRVSGQTLARIGEDMSWGGPATAIIDPETKRKLHEACGEGEIYIVGSPEASERFVTQYPHVRNPSPAPPPPSQPLASETRR